MLRRSKDGQAIAFAWMTEVGVFHGSLKLSPEMNSGDSAMTKVGCSLHVIFSFPLKKKKILSGNLAQVCRSEQAVSDFHVLDRASFFVCVRGQVSECSAVGRGCCV